MQLNVKTILNETAKEPRIEVKVEPRKGSKGVCSGCGDKCSGYDHLPQRDFIHVPLWGLAVVFLYCMRRVECPKCGVKVETVPWSVGKSPLTTSYAWHLSEWAKLLSMDLSNVTAIDVDEIHWSKKQGFMTLVYQIDNHCKRLLDYSLLRLVWQ